MLKCDGRGFSQAVGEGEGEGKTYEIKEHFPIYDSSTLMCVFVLSKSLQRDFLSYPSASKRTAQHHESTVALQQSFHAKTFTVYEA